MNTQQKYLIDACSKALYDGNPQGALLDSVDRFVKELTEYAEQHPESSQPLADSGLQDEYGQLYMAVINRNYDYSTRPKEEQARPFDYSQVQRAPTVHEFLDTYRHVYEMSVEPNNRPLTDAAYQKLFDVENRTDDIIEAQIIIEKEQLILNTVTADYKYLAEDFLEAADPNYEITSATVNATIAVYATATSLEEVAYMGELAQATCDDIAVQNQIKVSMMANFTALIYAWERAKRKVREGGRDMADNAKAMAVTRKKMRDYYRFLSEDMGLTFEVMEKTPFYRISMLNPQGLDELWRIKKVMHPDNIEATKYVLFEEILSDLTLGEILLKPQPFPYYEPVDTLHHPEVDDEFQAVAEDLIKDIKFFQRNRQAPGRNRDESQQELIRRNRDLQKKLSKGAISANNGIGSMGSASGNRAHAIKESLSIGMKSMDSGTKKEIAKDVAATVAKDIGRGLLRGLFKR